MKTYKDGLLEAAKVCDNYVESYIYSAMAIEIRALAAQEDQPQEQSADDGETLKQDRLNAELEKEQLWGKSQSVRAEQAESRAAALEEALSQMLDDMGADGFCVCPAAKEQAIAAMGGDMTPERAAEILDQATNKGEQLKAQIVEAILQSCAEQREADAKIAEGYELPGKLVAAAIRGQT